MAIDPKLPIPVYFQLKTLLVEEILEGRYGPDGRLPTEHELCERHGISRTPVTRALSELATEGVVIRHRRRGTFVNPHWVHGHRGGPELRVIVPEGPWEGLIRRAAPADTRFSVATVELHELHHALTHAVAEGLGPDLAVLDSVRTRARAQDNQVYAVGANLTGNGFCGRSLVADPRGDVVAEAGVEETVFRAVLDLAAIDREREREPALRLRQPDLYRHGRL
jgi:multiple sugar transport system substrate-binding protein